MVAQSDWLPMMMATGFANRFDIRFQVRRKEAADYRFESRARKANACQARNAADILGNDVRGELIFDRDDAITQHKLAFFQPLDLQQVGTR